MMALPRSRQHATTSKRSSRARPFFAIAAIAASACILGASGTAAAAAAAAAVLPGDPAMPGAANGGAMATSTGLASSGPKLPVGTTDLPPDGFVAVKNARLVIGPQCNEFFFAGWNQWEMLELAANAPSPPFRKTPLKGQQHVVNVLDDAVKNGLKVRAWAHTITKGVELMTAPGVYNDQILAAMDWVMEQLRIRNLRVQWVLADNWYPIGGIDGFAAMAGSKNRTDFFTSPTVKKVYQDHIGFLLNRKNTINGRVYKEDPTIMAWNLANEARCTGCPSSVMQSWIDETCAFVKSVDKKHLVGIGYEGFYGPDSGKLALNPGLGGSDWASKEGQDFVQNSKTPCIDYVGFHVWPDNWNFKDPDFQKQFIQAHIDDVKKEIPNKPLIMEEFGKIVEDPAQKVRNQYFANAFAAAEESAKSNGPLMGTLFWHWYDLGVGPGQYGVHKTDSTFALIQAHAKVMDGLYDNGKKFCPA